MNLLIHVTQIFLIIINQHLLTMFKIMQILLYDYQVQQIIYVLIKLITLLKINLLVYATQIFAIIMNHHLLIMSKIVQIFLCGYQV
jgi:hypothetical protein